MVTFPPLVERALAYPGALFIRSDTQGFRDPAAVAYEIGLEQPRAHVRFANVFVYGAETWLYVKHDPARIGELYGKHGGRLMPSELASKHWSKLRVDGEKDALAAELLARSHELVWASLPEKGRAAIKELGRSPNLFPEFHRLAMGHRDRERVSITYSELPSTPELSVDGAPIARFGRNALHLRQRKGDAWDVLDATQVQRWEPKLAEVVRYWLGVQRP